MRIRLLLQLQCLLVAIGLAYSPRGSTAARSPSPAAQGTLYELLSNTPDLQFALELFNYTGLLPLAKDPATQITCFLPSSQFFNNSYFDVWEGASKYIPEQRGRYMWAVLLHHCLYRQTALTTSQLRPRSLDTASITRGIDGKLHVSPLRVRQRSGALTISAENKASGTAKIITPNLQAGKSIVHIIDKVLIPGFAPPSSFSRLSEFLQKFNDTTSAMNAILSASTNSLRASLNRNTEPYTFLAPTSTAVASLLSQLNTSLATLLTKPPLCDLLVRAHVIPGRDLWTGAFISLPGPVQLRTAAGGALNATADLPILPGRRGTVRFISLTTQHSSALLSDSDIGGSGNDGGNLALVPWVAHFVDSVLLPASIAELKAML